MKSFTVSAKIRWELREKLKKYGIKVSEVINRALEEEVLRLEEKELKRKLDEVSSRVRGKIGERDIVLAVRASREER